MFPNKGVGFHIFKKNWTPGLYYSINRAVFKVNLSLLKSYKHGHFYGIKHAIGYGNKKVVVDNRPKRLNGLSKRGCWTYSLG